MAGNSPNPEPGIYTTGQVARMTKVAPRTVSKWFDSGVLGGYRIPGSEDRRIPRADLVIFLRNHKMPIPVELDDVVGHSAVIVSSDESSLETGLPVINPFEFGRAVNEFQRAVRPAALVVVLLARDGMDVCLRLAKAVRAADDRILLLMVVGDDVAVTGTFGVIDKLVGESAAATVAQEAVDLIEKFGKAKTTRKMPKSPTYGNALSARHGHPNSVANLKLAPSHQKKENDRVEAEQVPAVDSAKVECVGAEADPG